MSLQTKSVFEFGPFRLDLAERLLTRNDEQIHLPPKAFDSLVELVKHSGHLLDKDELLSSVWPGTFVEESNLAQHISVLRKALHDGENGCRYIETVPRRGYRFVAEVREVGSNGLETHSRISATPTSEEPAPRSLVTFVPAAEPLNGRRRGDGHVRRSIVISAVIAVALVSIAISYFRWSSRTASSQPIHSIAVLPLQNLSGDARHDYFADGMTEALITDLAKFGSIRVISRTSTMQYKGSHLALPEIAKQLNVDAIVEGAVLEADDRVRITAQLIRASDDQHIWADVFERDGRDVLSLQGDLARSIAHKINLQLTPNESAELSNRRPIDLLAHEAYLRGRYFWNKRTSDDYKKSILSFQQAIDRDPNYAEAYAGLADAYALLGSSGNPSLPRAEAMEKARAAALNALRLDEGLAEAHTSLAFVRMHYDWKFAEAEKEFRRAIELNPSYATAHHWYAYDLAATGRYQEALGEVQRARELDPLSAIVNTDVAEFLGYQGRNDEALKQVRLAVELDPNFPLAHLRLAEIYDKQGKYVQAMEETNKSLLFMGDNSWVLRYAVREEFHLGNRTIANRYLEKLVRLATRDGKAISGEVASAYAIMGNKDAAFMWLEKAYGQRDGSLILLDASPDWDNIRADARFAQLRNKVGLPDLQHQ
jgi:TolB-like protein/DNA-binding winged helix-turn-helix (wHTH) protein/Tfp pilus assembly protein PilF